MTYNFTTMQCTKHMVKLECMGGRNAHRSNWYCPKCADNDEAIHKTIADLKQLTQEDRLIVFAHFCSHCGTPDTNCQCWNDE